MENLSRFALNNSRLVMVFIAAVVLVGILTYLTYPRSEDPTITIRDVVISTAFPGMAPTRIEDLITKPLEEKIREIQEVKDIRSDSKTGLSIIHVSLQDQYFDLAPIFQDIRNKMNDARGSLPDGTQGPFINDEVGLTAVATIALWSEGFSYAEMRVAAEGLQDYIYTTPGVKKVEIFGVQDERIYLEISNAKLAELGYSPGQIITTLHDQNIILPGGRIYVNGPTVIIEPSGNFESVREIEDLIFRIPQTGQFIQLRDFATVRRGYVYPPQDPVYFNGKPAIVISVSTLDGINSVAFGDQLTQSIKVFEGTLPVGFVLEYATFQPTLVETAVNSAVINVYQTLVIVLVVVMLFLGVRTGLIVGAIVPMSMLLAIIIMHQFDIELQRISIAAMIIALGLLVDNGIVVVEDIKSRLEQGEKRRDACIKAGQTLAVPLLTSSLTTILAFMPMMLAIGTTGEYAKSLSQVIIIILLGSWFLSMVVSPSLANWFLTVPEKKKSTKSAYSGKYYQKYRAILETLLARPKTFLLSLVGLLVASVFVFQGVSKEFFPVSDRNQFLIYADLPAGTGIEKTAEVSEKISAWLSDRSINPEIESNVVYVGNGGPRFFLSLTPLDPDPNRAFFTVNTFDPDDVAMLVERTREYLAGNVPDVKAQVKAMWMGSSEAGLVEVRISGPNADELYEKAGIIEAAFEAIPGTINIRNDWENTIPKLRIEVDQTRARRAQVTSQDIANSLNAFLSGGQVTEFREGDLIIPVLIVGPENERENLSAIASMSVFSPLTGKNVPLMQIATFSPEIQFNRIKREDQVRTITIQGKNRTFTASVLSDLLRPTLAGLDLKPGYGWKFGGEIEKSKEAQESLFANLPLAGLLIVVLLIWQFNSFRRPLIILLTLPLSFIGAVLGLVIMGAPYGFMTMLGLVSLAGIIINNGIVLIDRIDTERAHSKSIHDAIVASAVARFRPIIMTTATTVLGLTPLIFFGGDLWYGLANVIAFGLAVGTVLTLGVVPVLYSLFFREKTA